MKRISLLMLAGLCLGCKTDFTGMESAELKEFTPLSGVHCESSALLNALNHQGYNISEEEILGAGGILGFVYDGGKFPFLGGRSLNFKENLFKSLGIVWHKGDLKSDGNGWSEINKLLESDIPVLLRVDMRFLPYLYNGKYGSKYMSFGWHFITLVSMDIEKGTAYVTDTDKKTLNEIKLKDLDRARFSKLKVMPPEGEYYWVERAPEGFRIEWEEVVIESLKTVKSGMMNITSQGDSISGLKAMEKLPQSIILLGENTPSYLMEPVLNSLYGFIELYGTGGAAFRDPYLGFLKSKRELNKDFEKYIVLLEKSVEAWDNFSDYLKEMSQDKNNRDFSRLFV